MNKSTNLSHLYLEFKEKYINELGGCAVKKPLTIEEAEEFFGFKVKEINSFVERKDVDKKYIPYMNEQVCRAIILGIALPTTSGWILSAHPYTVFIAYGFNGEYTIFSLGNSNKEIDTLDLEVVENEYISIAVEYTEESAEIFETANPDKKPPTKH